MFYTPKAYKNLFRPISDEQIQQLIAEGWIIPGKEDLTTEKGKDLLVAAARNYYAWAEDGAFPHRISSRVPDKDPAFEAVCSKYKEDWAKHQQDLVVTSKTFKITSKG